MKSTFMVFITALMACHVYAYAQTPNKIFGIITEVSGTVELKHPEDSDFVPAKDGDIVSMDTVISTGFNSSAVVTIGSALITVRPVTLLSLTEIQSTAGQETLNMNLQAGRVRLDLNPSPGTRAVMSVISPNATTSVRGASFEFDGHNIRVLEGQVSVTGSQGRSTRVEAGPPRWIEMDGTVASPGESRTAAMIPTPPPGTSSTGRTSGDQTPAHAVFRINIWY